MTHSQVVCSHPLAYVRKGVHGWSQMELAKRLVRAERGRVPSPVVLASIKNKIWRWENYDTVPEVETQRVLAELFGVPSPDVQQHRWPYWLPVWEVPALELPWSPTGTVETLDDVTRSCPMDTRGFPVLRGSLLTDPAHKWMVIEPHASVELSKGRRIGESIAARIETQIETLRYLDDDFGGGDLRIMVEQLHTFTTKLLKDASYTDTIGRRLYLAAADLSRLAGWMAFEAGQHAAAQRYLLGALRAAHAVGDQLMGANVLVFLSIQSYSVGNPQDAVTLLDTARSGIRGFENSVVASMISARLARAHSKAGNRRDSELAMNRALDELSRSDPQQTPPWAYYIDEAEINAAIGTSWLEFNEYPRAQEALTSALGSRPSDSYYRDRSQFTCRLATSHAKQGNLEEAIFLAEKVLEINAHQINSGRAVELLVEFQQELEPYNSEPLVSQFTDRMRELVNERT